MPATRTPTFEEMFGIGKRPLGSYFGLPENAGRDTRFAPEASAILQQGEGYNREQNSREAEIAADELLGNAGNLTDDQIRQQVTQNPRIFGTKSIQPLANFMQMRQSTTPQSDIILGPQFEKKITNPRLLKKFKGYMLDDGLSANDAWEQYRRDEFNEDYLTQLAEVGVPDTEFAALKDEDGLIDPVAVSRRIGRAKAESKKGPGKATPLDEEIEVLNEALKGRAERLEKLGADLTKDPQYADLAAKLDKAYADKLTQLRPPTEVAPTTAPKVNKITEIADAPQVPLTGSSPEAKALQREEMARIEQANAATQGVRDKIARAWTDQKLNLTDEIGKVYKTPDELLGVAKAIVDGDQWESGNLDAEGNSIKIPYRWYLLNKLGKKPQDVVFAEPENERWGTQNVTNEELVQAWAEGLLKAAGMQQPQNAGGKIISAKEVK